MNYIFVLLSIAAYVAGTQAASCLEKSATFKKVQAAQAGCLTTLNLTTADIPTSNKDLKEKHFNDKCLSKCSLESTSLYNNGTFKKDTMLENLKKEVDTTVYDKLAKLVDTCIEKASAKPQKKDKDDKDKHNKDKKDKKDKHTQHQHNHGFKNGTCSCRKAAKFVYCMLEKDTADC